MEVLWSEMLLHWLPLLVQLSSASWNGIWYYICTRVVVLSLVSRGSGHCRRNMVLMYQSVCIGSLTAGGRMIGRKVSEMILDGRELEFYKWDGELSELLDKVKLKINEVADKWSREEKDKCLQETELSFKYSGSLLKLLAST